MISRRNLLNAVVGATFFAAAQWWLFSRTSLPLNDLNGGWFLNTGAAVATIAASVFLGALLLSGLRSREPIHTATPYAIGAGVAMTFTLGVLGLGNLFPLVLAFGGGIIFASSVAGSFVGWFIRQILSDRG